MIRFRKRVYVPFICDKTVFFISVLSASVLIVKTEVWWFPNRIHAIIISLQFRNVLLSNRFFTSSSHVSSKVYGKSTRPIGKHYVSSGKRKVLPVFETIRHDEYDTTSNYCSAIVCVIRERVITRKKTKKKNV